MKNIFSLLILILNFSAFSQDIWDRDCYNDRFTMEGNMDNIIKLGHFLEKNAPDSIIILLDKDYLVKDKEINNKLKEAAFLISKNYRKFHVSNSTPTIANEKQHYIKLNYYDPKRVYIVYSIISYFNHSDKNSKIVDIKFEDHFSEFQKILDEEDHEEPPPFLEMK